MNARQLIEQFSNIHGSKFPNLIVAKCTYTAGSGAVVGPPVARIYLSPCVVVLM